MRRAVGCDPVRLAFGLAALLALLLNFAVVALFPLFFCEEPLGRRLAELGRGLVPEAWSCLQAVGAESLRLLPDAALEAEARKRPRWLFFGLSSVHRKQAEYLGITLSHLFDALGSASDTGVALLGCSVGCRRYGDA